MADERRSIFITGAGSGIGLATARLFAGRGWFVGGFDVNGPAIERLAAELGGGAHCRTLDVTDRQATLDAVKGFGAAAGGRLDLLFSNAGIDAKGPFADMAWERVIAVIDVNLVGAMSVIHAGLPLLKATKGSLCLSTASASAIFGTAGLAAYSATKHGVKGLTEALSVELAAFGVRVADILPGIIDTGMLTAEQKAVMPSAGMWRPLPAEAVAETAWAAYHGDKLHWYVPAELAGYDVRITTDPETARDDRIAGRFG